MKSTQAIRTFILGLMLFSSSVGFSRLIETNSMHEALSTARADTLVILDLDNTVLEPVQTLGSDQFFGYLVKNAEAEGLANKEAVQWALQKADLVQPESKVRLVEQITRPLVHALQSRKITVMALTARPQHWASRTLGQVASLGVDFRKTSPLKDQSFQEFGEFRQGVFFLGANAKKGEALLAILKRLSGVPGEILFVDDKLSNVKSVEESLDTTPIPHVSYRYGHADPRVQSFRPSIANCEWNTFLDEGIFLTDEEAEKRIQARGCYFEGLLTP